MTEHILMLLAQTLLAAALAWTCFCRLVKTSHRTLREIRWSIWFLGMAAGMVLGAPVLPLLDAAFAWPPGTTPAEVWLLLLLAIVLVQLATSKHWRGGAPASFTREA
jgi:drug/metabolite transporter (DMT)-like permease